MSFLVLFFAIIVALEFLALLLIFFAWRQLSRWQCRLDKAQMRFYAQVKQGKAGVKVLQQLIQQSLRLMPLLFPWRFKWQWQIAAWALSQAFKPIGK